MDSSDVNPTRTQDSQMFVEEDSQEMPAASQPVYDVLIQNLSNLTLNPRTKFLSIKSENRPQPTIRRLGEGIRPQPTGPTGRRLGEGIIPRRKGVRTLLSVRRERMEWMIRYFKNRYGKTQTKSGEQRFRCTCTYCLYNRDPAEDNYENNYDSN
ncbi:developmental pluripotency-associated protein 3-like [Phacochoerus africanus]|uniref:developmental pluripotency-associated protein 3-like n=1 Tax=Phacochoerus africanus TaxID=41426 RepID=UPI001FD94867|nr:developmental pluripotency-associated protein 3-like [Phacochoerus africanus]